MCGICEKGKENALKMEKLKKNLEKNEELKDEIKKLEEVNTFYQHHMEISYNQRQEFNNKKSERYLNEKGKGHCLIVVDFKENIKLGKGPVELDKDFYELEPRTVLGFVIYSFGDQHGIKKQYYCVVSKILNHDAGFVKNSFLTLFHEDFFSFQSMDIFFDCGPHFRNGELLHFLLIQQNSKKINVNFFCEKHGKSPVDAFFSLVSRFKHEIEKHKKISSSNELIEELSIKIKNSNQEIQSHTNGIKNKEKKKLLVKFVIIDKIENESQNLGIKLKNIRSFYNFVSISENNQIQVLDSVLSGQEMKKVDYQIVEIKKREENCFFQEERKYRFIWKEPITSNGTSKTKIKRRSNDYSQFN